MMLLNAATPSGGGSGSRMFGTLLSECALVYRTRTDGGSRELTSDVTDCCDGLCRGQSAMRSQCCVHCCVPVGSTPGRPLRPWSAGPQLRAGQGAKQAGLIRGAR